MAHIRISKAELSASILKSIIAYNPLDGVFHWVKCPNRKIPAGSVAGKLDARGYVQIKIMGRSFSAHQLAWLYETGDWPREEIDHKDGLPSNNIFSNLRLGGNGINQQNIRLAPTHGSSGFLGVTKRKDCNKFRASISINGRSRNVGSFDSAEEAHAAYLQAKRQLHTGCSI